MDKKAERLKALIKGNVKDRPTFGTDPNDPWSTKSGISEDVLEESGKLNKFLLSKGIDPEHVNLQTKISHSKSSEFLNWKKHNVKEEIEQIDEDELLNQYLKTKGLNPKTASKISKISASKTGDFDKWKRDHLRGGRLPMIKKEDTDSETVTKPSSLYLHTMSRKGSLDARAASLKPFGVSGPGLRKNEDVFQDTYAATQSANPENYNQSTDDTETKKEPSNRVKVIKKIYKENRVNEDLYDHEKDDKSVETPRKKSSLEKLPNASAILTGGKTETGKPRDDIEIDPQMRMRPGNTGFPPQTQKKNNNK